MQPRLSSSKKFTSFPKEYLDQIHKVFKTNFKKQMSGGKIIIEGFIYTKELLLRVGYLEKGRLKQSNFEVSVEYKKKPNNAVKMIYLVLDVAASLMDEYFKSGDEEFPRSWTPFKVENVDAFIQYSTVNTKLEAKADELLGEKASDDLVQGEEEDEDEDKDKIISMLGLDKDEEK